jgi:hypothetical protein
MSRRDQAERVTALLRALALARDPFAEPRNLLPVLRPLQAWQGERLSRSFGDLRQNPRYRAAAEFFATELYGADDATWRDRDLGRMLPKLKAWLPEHMLETVAGALELDLLSHELDLAVTDELVRARVGGESITGVTYAAAYRAAGDRPGRERQLELLLAVGRELDRIVKKPLIYTILRLARAPARAAGLQRIQEFLEHGFAAFAEMGSADEFLAEIERREREAMARLFSGHPDPFGERIGA